MSVVDQFDVSDRARGGGGVGSRRGQDPGPLVANGGDHGARGLGAADQAANGHTTL